MWLRVRRIPNYEKEEDGEKKTQMKAHHNANSKISRTKLDSIHEYVE